VLPLCRSLRAHAAATAAAGARSSYAQEEEEESVNSQEPTERVDLGAQLGSCREAAGD
jgi:hypothetical protein